MRTIRLLDLGSVPALRSQSVYHAAAYAMTPDSPDSIILVCPDRPYVCIGYHQDLEKEVDVAYCQANRLPLLRREVGGGAVYLDDGQVFSQWVFQSGRLPRTLADRFELYIRPLVETYQALGIEAYYRPINDIHVAGKKIGGTGAANMGRADVVVGSLMFDFDKAAMARVLRVSSQKMRDKVFESLEQYMTTMREQLGTMPDRQAVKDLYIRSCARSLDAEIVPGTWTAEEEAVARDMDARFTSADWLYQKSGLRQRGVKIHEDVRVVESAFKAPGGLIRVTARLRAGHIDDVSLSGDFTLLPATALGSVEGALRGVSLSRGELVRRIQAVYQALRIQSPGLAPGDFAQAILSAGEA